MRPFVIGLAALVVLGRPGAAAALDVYALAVGANANAIVRFDSATPGTISGPTPVTGLGGTDAIKTDKAELKAFLDPDAKAGAAFCLGDGQTECNADCR